MNFYSNDITSKYIKYLLMNTYLPTCSYISHGDYMIEGGLYMVNKGIVRCTKSGLFLPLQEEDIYPLVCSKKVICGMRETNVNTGRTGTIVCGMSTNKPYRELASYSKVSEYTFGKQSRGFTENYISTYVYYDSETHKRLGDYLRCLQAYYSLNLMPLYNCFSNIYVNDIDLSTGRLTEVENPAYKTTLIPIKYNKNYTLYLNSNVPVHVKPVLYDKNVLRDADDDIILADDTLSSRRVSWISYDQPYSYRLRCEDKAKLGYERFLYLAVQIPVNNTSPITVIEGEHHLGTDTVAIMSKAEDDINLLFSRPSLTGYKPLHRVYTDSRPFSKKLVEYLLMNTVGPRDRIAQNVLRITKSLDLPNTQGEWKNSIRKDLFKKYMNLQESHPELNYEDILGYLDSDIEMALSRGIIPSSYDTVEV